MNPHSAPHHYMCPELIQNVQTIPEAISKTIKQEGIAGLYSGLSSSLFGIAVTNGVYYAFCMFTYSNSLTRCENQVSMELIELIC